MGGEVEGRWGVGGWRWDGWGWRRVGVDKGVRWRGRMGDEGLLQGARRTSSDRQLWALVYDGDTRNANGYTIGREPVIGVKGLERIHYL